MTIIGFVLFLVIAVLCAAIADSLVLGDMPGGFWGAALVGLVGAWLGDSLLGRWGPHFGDVFVLQTVIGSGIPVFLLSLYSTRPAPKSH